MSDSFDRRVLATYLGEYFGDFLLDQQTPFKFYTPRDSNSSSSSSDGGARDGNSGGSGGGASGAVGLPAPGPRAAYLAAIDALPAAQSPELFGLHANADIAVNTAAAKAMWAGLVDLQPRGGEGGSSGSGGSGGGGADAGAAAPAVAPPPVSRDELAAAVARDIEARLPPPFDIRQVRRTLAAAAAAARGTSGSSGGSGGSGGSSGSSDDAPPPPPPPAHVVLLQELEWWNALVAAMAAGLRDLRRALAGEAAASAPLEELAAALANGRLPAAWARLAPPTQKPLAPWLAWLARRHAQYAAWAAAGEEPKVMWLAGLHAPETYLAALVQAACRDRGWPLDRSELRAYVSEHADAAGVLERPRHGCYVEGVFLEGAAWDAAARRLTRQPPKQLAQELPLLRVAPAEAAAPRPAGWLRAPVYVTQARRDAAGRGLVFEADLATDAHESHWVLQGAALALNVDR